ncbi:histidinol dehydrogenase [Selenomonas sp. FOBRC6]|uniref:histidinol dehydrogenase n=1 Tax=Selenomonas sp. FOBRC6 TaxID=936572 RepID=UPI000277EB59|nr:histidinol dehydrogenase [Selenomonas sp. FOBRC6]EJO22835.1 histidinol dehydrogenase [Selenomonas sp. FOBRC6]
MNIVSVADVGMEATELLLKKKAFDELTLSDGIRKKNQEIFGEDLSATELVHRIVQEVRYEGDRALFRYTKLLDRVELTHDNLMVSEEEFLSAERAADPEVVASLKKAADNIFAYHEEQKPRSWMTYRAHGSILGQAVLPLARVGIYVPGGTAAYPSSVLMNAVPAIVAGVEEIIMSVPTKDGIINPYVLVAARLLGVKKIFKIGGAQAIAAMAYGTESVPRVDKITGPGNIFVTLAKKEVYGHVDIDMLAGPSEILILADESASAEYVAADLLSQAEHDPLASSILITTDMELAQESLAEVRKQLETLPRKNIARASLEGHGRIIVTENMDQAIHLANVSGPEHIELLVGDSFHILPKIRCAGAIFLGSYSPEPLGDYFAGPNHVLPTGGTARFYSVLNVETFMKRTSIISYTQEALNDVSEDIIHLAETEGLDAHARAIQMRRGC